MKYTILKKLPKGHTEMYCKIDKENKEKELKLANKEYRNSIKNLVEKSNRYRL